MSSKRIRGQIIYWAPFIAAAAGVVALVQGVMDVKVIIAIVLVGAAGAGYWIWSMYRENRDDVGKDR